MYKTMYTVDLMEVFIRLDKFCKKNGIVTVTPILMFTGLLKAPECSYFTRYLQKNMNRSKEEKEQLIACWEKNVFKETQETELINISYKRKDYHFYVSIELQEFLTKIVENIKNDLEESEPGIGESQVQTVNIYVSCVAMMRKILEELPSDVKESLEIMKVDIPEMQKVFSLNTSKLWQEVKTCVSIPKNMQTFLTDLTASVGDKELILGRAKETEAIWDIISKKNKRNAILVGKPGVGKTAIVYKLAQDIVGGKSPAKFKDYRIFSLEVTGLIAGTKYRGDAEAKFKLLNKFLETTENVILFIDEIHTMLGAGAVESGSLDLANSMKPILAQGKAIVIGATTTEEYEQYFSRDGALKRRFEKVEVKEPKAHEIYPMLENRIKDLEAYHGVKVEREVVDFIIFTASCFNYETKNPDRTLDLLDRSMAFAKKRDKKVLDEECVLANFDVNYEVLNKTTKEMQRSTACHEAGHFVVHVKTGTQQSQEVMAVSIMPTEEYCGVNVLEETDVPVITTIEYYIDTMATCLAGREAERMMLHKKEDSGASGDLEQATRIAYMVITKCGMVENYNMSYMPGKGLELLSEKSTDRINKSIERLLKKARRRARKILYKNRKLLAAVVDKLMEKQMLSKQDLEKIMEEIEDTNSIA